MVKSFMRVVYDIASSRPVTWLYLNVFPHIDRPLLRATGGRLSVSVGYPILLLETRGAKTSRVRTTPLFYVADGDDVVIIASNGGGPSHPAWYRNLLAHPRATLTLRGGTAKYTAREAEGEERGALWRKAVSAYPGYAKYRVRAGSRAIPVMVLSPVDS